MKTKEDVARYLTTAIERSPKTQYEIARDAGFDQPNVISMMKSGLFKVPLSRAPALALALDIEPRELLALCMEAYEPELYSLMAEHGSGLLVSPAEVEVVRLLRGMGLRAVSTSAGTPL